MRTLGWIVIFAGIACAQPPVAPVPTYDVPFTSRPPQIDGKLNDPAWQAAKPVEFVFPWESQTGAKQRTQFRVLWDEQNLYLGYDCDDTDITALYTKRDDPTYRDDAVELFLNVRPEQDRYYGFEMNAIGTMYDYFCVLPYSYIRKMDFVGMQLAVSQRGTVNQSGDKDQGWSLELAIPWHNFIDMNGGLPPVNGQVMTANLNRWDGVEPNRRLSQWSASGDSWPNPHVPARFGKLRFVRTGQGPFSDLGGQWELSIGESNFARQGAPKFKRIRFDQLNPEVVQYLEEDSGNGLMRAVFRYPADGKVSVNQVMGNPMNATAVWISGVLTIETRGKFGPNEIYLKDEYRLSADGKTLVQKRHFEGKQSGGIQDQTLLYRRN